MRQQPRRSVDGPPGFSFARRLILKTQLEMLQAALEEAHQEIEELQNEARKDLLAGLLLGVTLTFSAGVLMFLVFTV